jgi:hypothetical protein
VFFRLAFLQQRIADRPREWNINGPVLVYVPYFRFTEPKFLAAEAMWVSSDIRPATNFLLQPV